MNILYHDAYALIHKVETINILVILDVERLFKVRGNFVWKEVFNLTSKTETIFDLTESDGDVP